MGGVTYPPGDPAAQIYGIPIAFEAYTLFYNKDHVDKYLDGVVPETMPELIAAAQKISEEGASEGIAGAVMRGIRSDTIMDTLSGVTLNAFGDREAPSPYGMWFDGAWDNPRLDDPGVCQGLTDYAMMLAAGPPNKFAIDWGDANTLFQQGKAAFFIDASLFGPGYEDPDQSIVVGKTGYSALPPQEAGGNSLTGHWLWGLGIPKNAPEQGRCLVLHPVHDQRRQHGRDRQVDRWSAATERLCQPRVHRLARARVRRGRQRRDVRLARGGRSSRTAGRTARWPSPTRCWPSPTARIPRPPAQPATRP